MLKKLKKLFINGKSFKILSEYPVILIYQYNGVSTKNSHLLPSECNKIQGVDSLVIRNKIAQKILEKMQHVGVDDNLLGLNRLQRLDFVNPNLNPSEKNSIKNKNYSQKINNLFQGPTIILGCKSIDQTATINNLMKTFFNFLFVGGSFHNQIISHYTLEKLVDLVRTDSTHGAIFECIQLSEYKLSSMVFFKNQLNSRVLGYINVCNKNGSQELPDTGMIQCTNYEKRRNKGSKAYSTIPWNREA